MTAKLDKILNMISAIQSLEQAGLTNLADKAVKDFKTIVRGVQNHEDLLYGNFESLETNPETELLNG